MTDHEVPPRQGEAAASGAAASGPTSERASDTTTHGVAVHDTPPHDTVATGPPAYGHSGWLDRVRSTVDAPARRRALGWALLVAWLVWLVALWVVQPRLVPQEFLAGELAQGRPTAFSLVTVREDRSGGPFSTLGFELSPVSDEDRAAALDGSYSGPAVSIAYWVDAPVADLRVVDPDGLGSDVPAALVHDLTAAAVPEAPPGRLWLDPPAQRTGNAGALLALVSTLVVILGPRPRRGTRWFWFWIAGGPLAIGVAVFAVAELIRPRVEPAGTVHPPGVAGRWRGLAGFAIGFVLSIAGVGLTIALTNLSPIWFLRT